MENLTDLIKLDVGCGLKKLPGTVGIDKVPGPTTNVIFDLESLSKKGVQLPYADNTVIEIYCYHTLEHTTSPVDVMNEFHRVLMPGGWLHIIVPHALSYTAFSDPTHKSFFVPQTFDHFRSDNIAENNFDYGIKPWHIEKLEYTAAPRGGENLDEYRREITVKMRPLK